MGSESLQIIPCPPSRITEALALVLCEIAPSQRREIAERLVQVEDPADISNDPLYIALRGEQLCGVAWGQRQTGNIAMFWPPQLVAGEDEQTAVQLAAAVIDVLDRTAIEMTQALLPSSESAAAPSLNAVGFQQLAELLYMSCEAARFATAPPDANELEFESYNGAKRARLLAVVEQTYRDTLDCVGLNGMRTMEDVISGYQGTGDFRADRWQIVRAGGQDVGVLLLADHPQARHWELMYMGLIPEVRGHGWGGRITEYAKWLAYGAGIERIVLGVDSINAPALRIYQLAGFETWDRRTVYVRFPGEKTPSAHGYA